MDPFSRRIVGWAASPTIRREVVRNAVAESVFSGVKKERIKKRIHKNRELATADVAQYINVFCNQTRRHSHLGGVSPDQFEAAHKPRRQHPHSILGTPRQQDFLRLMSLDPLAALLFVLAMGCALAGNIITERQVREVNAHLPPEEQIPQWFRFPRHFARLRRAYRTVCPNGRLEHWRRALGLAMFAFGAMGVWLVLRTPR